MIFIVLRTHVCISAVRYQTNWFGTSVPIVHPCNRFPYVTNERSLVYKQESDCFWQYLQVLREYDLRFFNTYVCPLSALTQSLEMQTL